MDTLSLRRLTPAIGAVVAGVDLARPLAAKTIGALTRALDEYQVLFFREQDLTPVQHRDFAARFGPLHIHPIYPQVPAVPEILVLDTAITDVRDNAIWHTDVTFIETPPLGSVLLARTIPSFGGDTIWANMTRAYEALSLPIRTMLNGLSASHDFSKSFPSSRFGQDDAALDKLEAERRRHPIVHHPVVRVHPSTGAKGLFVNEGFTISIDELSDTESTAVLDLLFNQMTRPEFTVRWNWKEGDVAFWDNRATQHYALNDYGLDHRVMHRATILGDRPKGPRNQ